MGPTRVLTGGDRDNAGSYVTFVEFSSYEEAMKYSSEKMGAFCDGPPIFHNFDILRVDIPS